MSESQAATNRYDIVIFGAGGFTGQYLVEETIKASETNIFTWAIAGRSESKLKDVLKNVYEVTGQLGGDENEGDKDADEQAELERQEALREAEERRKEKHRKMEEEREIMRQGIRDKYGIKKKEEITEEQNQALDSGGSLNRRKKTPEELAKEAEAEEEDEFTKLKNSLESQVNELKQQIEGKCVLQ